MVEADAHLQGQDLRQHGPAHGQSRIRGQQRRPLQPDVDEVHPHAGDDQESGERASRSSVHSPSWLCQKGESA